MQERMQHQHSCKEVIRVGAGRGFLVEGDKENRYVITAAHCLPQMPPAIGTLSYFEERTYPSLLGDIGAEPTVWAECVFVDPISDVAVLGGPDDQSLGEEAEAYDNFVQAHSICDIGGPVPSGRVLALDGFTWQGVKVKRTGRNLTIGVATEGGQSGSPIVRKDSDIAVGLVSMGSFQNGVPSHESHGQPILLSALPGWLTYSLMRARAIRKKPLAKHKT